LCTPLIEPGPFNPTNGTVYLDADGDGVWDASQDITAPFGRRGDKPVIGHWAQ